jgi:hypothetical protein
VRHATNASGSISSIRLPNGSSTRRPEIRLHAQVDFEAAALEPAAATLGEVGRLLHLGDAEHTLVESSGIGLATGRHRQLHVIERFYQHGCSPGKGVCNRPRDTTPSTRGVMG